MFTKYEKAPITQKGTYRKSAIAKQAVALFDSVSEVPFEWHEYEDLAILEDGSYLAFASPDPISENAPTPFQSTSGKWYVFVWFGMLATKDKRLECIELEQYIADWNSCVDNWDEQALVYPAMHETEGMLPPPIPPVIEDGEVSDPDETYIWLRKNEFETWRLETHHYETFVDAICYPSHYKRYVIRAFGSSGATRKHYVWSENQESAGKILEMQGYKIVSCCLAA